MLRNTTIEVFLIRLKNSSTRYYPTLFLVILAHVFFLSACVQNRIPRANRNLPISHSVPTTQIKTIPLAPWEVWNLKDYGNEAIKAGNRSSTEGNLNDAIDAYSKSLGMSKSAEEAETALLLLTSTYLKSGKGKEALATITKYSTKKGVKPTQLDSRFSLLTGYAYLQPGDVN